MQFILIGLVMDHSKRELSRDPEHYLNVRKRTIGMHLIFMNNCIHNFDIL